MATTLIPRAVPSRRANGPAAAQHLIDSDLSPVAEAADVAVIRWLMASALAVILTVAVGEEWWHRLLAHGAGLTLAVPYFVLLLRRQIRPDMRLRLMNLPLLAALQGAMGWYMVQGGVWGRMNVSAHRLAAHLGIALVILGIAAWTAAELSRDLTRPSAWRKLRRAGGTRRPQEGRNQRPRHA
ncbi:MAG TPA: COX15/CtaA family protein [Gemmatimonadaceae bacterium]